MRTNPNPGLGIDEGEDRAADPRGIRVTLAPTSANADLPPLVLEPPAIPLVAVASVAGRGPLGGTMIVPPAPPAEPSPVVANGRPIVASLTMIDAERAVLVRGDDPGSRTSILLLPPSGAGGPVRGAVRREVVVDGWRVEVDVEPAARAALRERARRGREEIGHSGPTEVRAIIPGVVVSVSIAAGDAVSAGQQLLVVEAMKMQNELRAPRDGTVERVAVAPGRTIEVGDLLLVLV
jgi:biotin carboxyl carrier protein